MTVLLPKRSDFPEENDIEVICDPAFINAVKYSITPLNELSLHVNQFVTDMLSSGKPTRTKKKRNFEVYVATKY